MVIAATCASTCLVLTVTGCGSKRPSIEGGTAAQRKLLAEIVARAPSDRIASIRLISHRDGYEIEQRARGKADLATDWQEYLIMGAFTDGSVLAGLPPVASHQDDAGGGVLGYSARHPHVPAPARAADAVRIGENVRRLAVQAGARVLSISVTRPLGVAIDLRLAVDDPADFLAKRAVRSFLGHSGFYGAPNIDGMHIVLVDSNGGYAWSAASSYRGLGVTQQMTAPPLAGCAPIVFSRAYGAPRDPPCPTIERRTASIERRVKKYVLATHYLRKRDALGGPLDKVRCGLLGGTFHGAPIWLCHVIAQRGDDAPLCAVRLGSQLVTSDRRADLTCLAISLLNTGPDNPPSELHALANRLLRFLRNTSG